MTYVVDHWARREWLVYEANTMQLNPFQWRFKHSYLLAIGGALWFSIGIFLLRLGIDFIMYGWTFVGFSTEDYSPLFQTLTSLCGDPENACVALIALGLVLGYVKGNFVMKKAAQKTYARISALPNPAPLAQLYTKANLMLIAGMMCLGMLMGLFEVPYDIRGFIDTAVGVALIQGATLQFRFAFAANKAPLANKTTA